MTFEKLEFAFDGSVMLQWRREDLGVHRASRSPGDDVADLPEDAQAEIAEAWTAEFVAAWLEEHYPAPDFAQLQDAKKAAAQARHDALFCEGYTVPSGALAGRVLQTALAANISDWTLSWVKYHFLIAAGQGATEGAMFRDAENVTTTVRFDYGASVLDALLAWGENMRKRLWAIKDAIKDATTEAELDGIDINSGWPQ